MSRWHQQLVKRHRAARARAEAELLKWALFADSRALSDDRQEAAWHQALPWQKLNGRLAPGAALEVQLPLLEHPFMLMAFLPLYSGPETAELSLLLDGKFAVLGRMPLYAGQPQALRPMLIVPTSILDFVVRNTSDKRRRFRGLLVGHEMTPASVARVLGIAAAVNAALPVSRGPLLFPGGKP